MIGANLREAKFVRGSLERADLREAYLGSADLKKAYLRGADLTYANLQGALPTEADLSGVNLSDADLDSADLSGASLNRAILVHTNLQNAVLSGCNVYGIAAWDVNVDGAVQSDLAITDFLGPHVRVDNLRVAQFIYLLLTNPNVREVIDTVGRKGVLLLGRFTGGRMATLERLREELRSAVLCPLSSTSINLSQRILRKQCECLRGCRISS